jgi:hypothetical protein
MVQNVRQPTLGAPRPDNRLRQAPALPVPVDPQVRFDPEAIRQQTLQLNAQALAEQQARDDPQMGGVLPLNVHRGGMTPQQRVESYNRILAASGQMAAPVAQAPRGAPQPQQVAPAPQQGFLDRIATLFRGGLGGRNPNNPTY